MPGPPRGCGLWGLLEKGRAIFWGYGVFYTSLVSLLANAFCDRSHGCV
jgi:hypothetical protein